jgi:hypothetical protein
MFAPLFNGSEQVVSLTPLLFFHLRAERNSWLFEKQVLITWCWAIGATARLGSF